MYPDHTGLESPAMADDEGVLGNLPRSRPGKRSEKRDSAGRPSNAARKAAVKAEAAGKAAAKPARASNAKAPAAKAGAKPRRAATPKRGRKAAGSGAPAQRGATSARASRVEPVPVRPQPAEPAAQQSGDAVANAVHAAATVAATGVRVAGAVTREIMRRLPLP